MNQNRDIKGTPTSITVLIDVSYVCHCKTKHGGLLASKKLHWDNFLPLSSTSVDVNVYGSSDMTVTDTKLWRSYSQVLPAENTTLIQSSYR